MDSSEGRTVVDDSQSSTLRALPGVVAQVRDSATSSLSNHLNRMFASCDDVFFELAQTAHSNNEQNTFFEAMREIRLKKDGVIARFIGQFEKQFLELRKSRHAGAIDAKKPGSADALDLVQTEEMESSVAITSMVTRARLDCQNQLYHLAKRLDYLLVDVSIDERNNPLDPQQIGNAFKSACDILDLDIAARLVLFKHFEKTVTREFHTLIATANQQLINAGVLPKVSHKIQKTKSEYQAGAQPSDQTPVRSKTAPAPHAERQFSQQFSELSELLRSVRELAISGNLGFPLFLSTGAGPALDSDELTSILTQLQRENPLKQSGAELLKPQLDLRSLLTQALQQRQSKGEKTRVGKSDEDVINLIAMFFDFVLDDKNLPIQVQALISRLQIPVLKIALRDKKFFSSSSHPARRLINEVVAAGIGLSDKETESKTALVAKISQIVHDIHDHYEDGDAVFLTSLEVLRTFRKQEDQRASKIEKRTSEAAEAEAKTRHTKAMIEDLVLERLGNVEIPQQIQDFAVGEWQQVLLLAKLKHGNDSTEWNEALQTLDDLIWSSQRHDDEKSQRRLQRIIPDLQTRLQHWLATAKPTDEHARECLAPIVSVFESLLNPADAESVGRGKLGAHHKQALQATPRDEKPWKEMTAVERQQVQYQALTYDFIRKADEIPIGSWILFGKTAHGDSIRCKLAAKIETSDTFVFVNRAGFKIAEKKRKEFAHNLQEGRAQVLQQEWFFDRIMSKVSARLLKHATEQRNLVQPA